MRLKVKFLKWSAGIPVAMLHENTAEKLGVHTKGRITLRTLSKYSNEISTPVNTANHGLIKENEIIVSSEIRQRMKLKKSQLIDVNLVEAPYSLELIKKKLNGRILSENEISEIIKDIINNKLTETEIALFISSMYEKGMTLKETAYLTKAIVECGDSLKLKKKLVADKHCIGGIPGNRTTPIVVSICAAAGLIMPKTSSKAITSAAGTADVIEVLAPVAFSSDKLRKFLDKTNAFLVWGGALEIVPADAKIIRIEMELNIDPEAQLLASIMSKKLAVGSNYILIDIPFGESAKVSKEKALRLKDKFEKLGKYFHKTLKVVLTKGDQPIGNGIGPVLEMIDVLKVLDPNQVGPLDLENKSLFLAGELLEMTGKSKKGKGFQLAKEILDSGKAFEKFKQIIKVQGGKIKKLEPANFKHNILSNKSGKIISIDNKLINSLARTAGCPADKSSGIYLYFHKDSLVKKGDKLITIYSEYKSRLNSAIKFYNKTKPIKIN